MPEFNFNAQDPFAPNPGESDKDSTPASEEAKRGIYDRARAVALTGEYREPFERSSGFYMKDAEVPGTKDTLKVVSYDAPSQTPGLEGFVMQITHSKAVVGSRVVTDEGLELYRREITKYKFYEIPDGLHVEREVDQSDKPVEYYHQGPSSAEDINWDALEDAYRAAEEDRAMQRELGFNFFSEADAENVASLMEQTWPTQV